MFDFLISINYLLNHYQVCNLSLLLCLCIKSAVVLVVGYNRRKQSRLVRICINDNGTEIIINQLLIPRKTDTFKRIPLTNYLSVYHIFSSAAGGFIIWTDKKSNIQRGEYLGSYWMGRCIRQMSSKAVSQLVGQQSHAVAF